MEHRWGQRVVVDVPIRLVAGPFSGRSARLTNLSVSGGCIKSSFELRPLARVNSPLNCTCDSRMPRRCS